MNYLLFKLNFSKLDSSLFKSDLKAFLDENNKNDLINLWMTNLKEKLAHEVFIAAKGINIELMKYAMDILDREEAQEKKRKRKQEEK